MGKKRVATETKNWRSRIVGQGEEVPENLLANPKNWRIHPKEQQEGLEAVLDRVGWVQNVVVNQRTGHLVDGHLRVTLAMRRNEPKIPVVYVDLTPEEEELILLTLDPLAGLAGVDREQLRGLLDGAQTGADPSIDALLSKIASDGGVVAPPFPPAGEEDQGRLDQRNKHRCPSCGHEF
jgi:hypothetical protein